MSANDTQVGGNHYSKHGALQHWDVVAHFQLDYFQGQITKYVMRWRDKGSIQDLKKARHFLDKYIEVEEARAAGRPIEPIEEFLGIEAIRARQTEAPPPLSSSQEDDPAPEPGQGEWAWASPDAGGPATSPDLPSAPPERKIETEPCCECGQEYPREDLMREPGHIYCPKCRLEYGCPGVPYMQGPHDWETVQTVVGSGRKCRACHATDPY